MNQVVLPEGLLLAENNKCPGHVLFQLGKLFYNQMAKVSIFVEQCVIRADEMPFEGK